MPILTFVKGAVAGGVGATVLLAATAAVAGTGVGGVFNLGQVNSVNETTSLTGSKAGAQLQVTNTSTAAGSTGLKVTTASGKPAITVSNPVKNPNLNADLVDGISANGLGRLAIASTETLGGLSGIDTQATVAITAPKQGFVRLEGNIVVYDGFDNCNQCAVFLRVHDDATSADSPMSFFAGGDGAVASGDTVSVSWVFPATAGAHTYSLTTTQSVIDGDAMGIYNPTLVAQYVPFGGTGSPTSLGRSRVKTSSEPQQTVH